MSVQVMSILESCVPALEVYSVDEVFADLAGNNLVQFGRELRTRIFKNTRIPVGIGPSKTLAKLTNHPAKRLIERKSGVVNLCGPRERNWTLRNTKVGEALGVGKRMAAHFEGIGIITAMNLARTAPATLRARFSVVIEKTARELAGTPCLALGEEEPPKQKICVSRMFGKRLTEVEPIKEAVASYVKRAAEKLRAQGAVCKRMRVSTRAGMFNPEEAKYAQGALVDLPYPTNEMLLLTRAGTEAVNRIFRPGFRYSKAEVLLLDLRQTSEFTGDLFALRQSPSTDRIMPVMDEINGRWGRGTVRSVSMPTPPDWAMQRDLMSQVCTTRIHLLCTVKCN